MGDLGSYLSGADADTRTIATGDDVEGGTAFYLARRGFFEESPDLVRTVLAAVAKCDDWAANHRDEVIALLARSTGLAPDVVARSLAKLRYGLLPMTPDVVAGQQAIADGFHAAGLLTRCRMWPPQRRNFFEGPVSFQDAV
ncbi:type 2 periplasmic-binding domain-containing protein [Komagataeibacter kakiaceti]|uniref:hypothetical protein n=1 Tax=Komagataeibacter kakiaceti TaxID=943261 RepID=UPI001F5A52C8|nr:hypothetical protein [Komagataeibacter kakiaceti]